MNWRGGAACGVLLLLLGTGRARAQEPGPAPSPAPVPAPSPRSGPSEPLAVRVLSMLRQGVAVIDRGARDAVLPGDAVVLQPRSGAPVPGSVLEVQERTAAVRLDDRRLELPAGTPGTVAVPVARLAERAARATPAQGPAPHAPWVRQDDDWQPGMPLLSAVEIRRPEQRPPSVSGRMYFIGDGISSTLDDRSDVFLRLGTDLHVDNPFGDGGQLHYSGELNHRATDVPPPDERAFGKYRINRLSYSHGGNRFEPERWEFGRFLQHGMPEFGVLDGVEWGRRLHDGSSLGASFGLMPEPDVDMADSDDLQLAGYYRWVSDESERLAVSGGYQKTWHEGESDRDLFVGKLQVLPADGWSLQGTVWIDLYTSDDDAKGSGLELTQAIVRASRRWDGGTGLDLTWSHLRFPELLRGEFQPVTLAELADARNDRLALAGYTPLSEDLLLRAEVGAWDDEDDSGGDAELGFELEDLFVEGGQGRAAVYGVDGRFSEGVGARVGFGRQLGRQHWDVDYEVSEQHEKDFDVGFADVLQHWLRARWGISLEHGWDLSLGAGLRLWDQDERSTHLSVYAQKRF